MNIEQILIKEFGLQPFQVENTIELIDAGNTIPFIARYRKEKTGTLDDQVLRKLSERLVYLRNLENRKAEVKKLIEEQGKLTSDISSKIDKATILREIEDIYRPYKPKKRTRAMIAKEKGLEPLSKAILVESAVKVDDLANEYIDESKDINSISDAINGAKDIIAEAISDNALFRNIVRTRYFNEGIINTKSKVKKDTVYNMYYDYSEPINKIAGHRILAINRGEKEKILAVSIEVSVKDIINNLLMHFKNSRSKYVVESVTDSFSRLMKPSVENEVRGQLTEAAQDDAIKIFKGNLKSLLLQAPVKNKVVLGFDPGFRTGCKLAVVDHTGKTLDTGVVYPTMPHNKVEESKKTIIKLINKYSIDVISIGNGTASRESEIFIADVLKSKEIKNEVRYTVVSEAGASIYSASELASKEFPEYDVSVRSAISIARRLQDPLAELVKIDPQGIGVGQYQHDMNQKKLGESLHFVVEDCVNSVGVDLNTASPSLLSYVAGINKTVAENIIQYRNVNGAFSTRKEIKKVSKLGEKSFLQCAGFLRIPKSKNVLDNTGVHPESYKVAKKYLDIKKEENTEVDIVALANKLEVGIPTLTDIIEELKKPGRDPREVFNSPQMRQDVMDIKDIKKGMVLTGTVRNVSTFGAFVDIGVHQDGLVHISQLSNSYVKNPMDIVNTGDVVKVKVIDVDIARKRISLSMKD